MAKILSITIFLLALPGCASLVSSATSNMADNISLAILNQDDPETVREGAPAYLLMIDGLVEGDPENGKLLLAGSRLYGSYASAFVDDQARAQRLAGRSLAYARRALCLDAEVVCAQLDARLEPFRQSLEKTGRRDLEALYTYGVAWAGWIQHNSSDWNAIADLARVTALFEHCLVLDENHDGGGAHIYLGVLKSLLPPAVGGKPEIARAHFERAIEISAGNNLMVKVLMAKHYARLVFDKELHDSLLTSVQAASTEHEGYTLMNSLAQAQARQLLAESEDFF